MSHPEEKVTSPDSMKQKSLSCWFECRCNGLDVDDATGFQYFFMGSGPIILSNVFLAASLISLAQRSLQCVDEDECDGKVYGFKPSSLITIIATVSSIMSAFFLPLFGAIVDFTSHRKLVGQIIALLIIVIQAIQIATIESTWFVMSILQALNGFLFQALELISFAYLPEIKRVVGEAIMTSYSSLFYSRAFCMQALFVVIVIGLSVLFNVDDVVTGQISQATNVVLSGTFFSISFNFFTPKDSRRESPKGGQSLLNAGFKNLLQTTKGLVRYYPTTLTWFLLSVVFAQSAASAFTTVAITYFIEVVRLDSKLTGLIFLIILLSMIPGSSLARFGSKKLESPILFMQTCLATLVSFNFVAFLTLKADVSFLVWPYAVIWGILLGAFYPTEMNIYASLMPSGQEAELSGFYLYCAQVLTWLPPLVFTIMNETGIPLKWGGLHLNIYLTAAFLCYQMMPTWNECEAITQGENKIINVASAGDDRDEIQNMTIVCMKNGFNETNCVADTAEEV